jgi:hypothetical protein
LESVEQENILLHVVNFFLQLVLFHREVFFFWVFGDVFHSWLEHLGEVPSELLWKKILNLEHFETVKNIMSEIVLWNSGRKEGLILAEISVTAGGEVPKRGQLSNTAVGQLKNQAATSTPAAPACLRS